jgi:hypothetical protein
MILGVRHNEDWLAEATVLEKHAVSISRAEVMIWDSEGLYRVVEGEV